MTETVSGNDVNDVLRLVVSKTPDGDAQLTILALALITALRSCQIPRERALELIGQYFDNPPQSVPLVSPGSGEATS